MDDDELARAVRESLTRRAERAEPDPAVIGRSRAAATRRRRARLAVVGAAAAVVLLVGTVVVVTTGRGEDDVPPAGPAATDDGGSLPTEWRTEYWRGVQVDVPADWGFSGAPIRLGSDELICSEQTLGPDGRLLFNREADERPYVGRPIANTDVCGDYHDRVEAGQPATSYVWLGAPDEPGVVTWPNGIVQETIAVADTTVTVGSVDERLRAAILATARPSAGQCEAELPSAPARPGGLTEGWGKPIRLEVCVYQRGRDGTIGLAYGRELGKGAATEFDRALTRVRTDIDVSCDPRREWVVLRLTGTSYENAPAGVGGTQEMLADFRCGALDTGHTWVELTPELSSPWLGGIGVVSIEINANG